MIETHQKERVIRYKRTSDVETFKRQLEDFEKKAEAGETICLTDLLINAEDIHLKHLEGEK